MNANERKADRDKWRWGNTRATRENKSLLAKISLLTGHLVAAILLVSLLAMFIAGASAATTYTVCASGCDYTSIQAAVTAASPGDTIIVQNGTYTESMEVNKSLTICSQYGAAFTTVQAADPGDVVFYVTADDVTICGFTVTGATDGCGIYLEYVNHCAILNNDVSSNSLGIYLYESSNNTLSCNIANNETGWGSILLSYSSNNELSCNTANENYIGIYLGDSSNNELSCNTANANGWIGIWLDSSSNNNELSCNTANANGGDGIWLWSSSNNTLSCNTANANDADNILLQSSNNNELTGNTANEGTIWGISLWSSSNNTLTGNDVSLNKYEGIILDGSSSNTLTGNNASSNKYDGICLASSKNNSITCNLVAYNGQRGFFLYFESTGNTISNNTIMANGEYNAATGGWEWNFDNQQTAAVVALHNYWGTDNSTDIAAGIKENTGTVDYEPFLTDPEPCVPTGPVSCASTCSGSCPNCPVPCYEPPGPVPRVPITETATVLLIGLLALAGYLGVRRSRK